MVCGFFVIIIPTPVWVFDLDFDWGVATIDAPILWLLKMHLASGFTAKYKRMDGSGYKFSCLPKISHILFGLKSTHCFGLRGAQCTNKLLDLGHQLATQICKTKILNIIECIL